MMSVFQMLSSRIEGIKMLLLTLSLLVVLFGQCQAAWNVTCDFDLDGIEEIVEYLPSECQEIYRSGSASELYQASLAESDKFQEFFQQLDAYERKANGTPPDEIPEKNTTLRFDIYNAVTLSECTNDTESLPETARTKEYYDCLLGKREQMINLIPK